MSNVETVARLLYAVRLTRAITKLQVVNSVKRILIFRLNKDSLKKYQGKSITSQASIDCNIPADEQNRYLGSC